jgi:hypothetical protein
MPHAAADGMLPVMDTQEPFTPPRRVTELAVDSFWIALVAAMAFYVFGVVIGIVHPGEVLGMTAAFLLLCALWGARIWWAHRNEAYLRRDPRLHHDRERRGY